MQRIGVLTGIFRYPVKSMHGESVARAMMWWTGLEGDRRYGFVRSNDTSRFPWLTAREEPTMLHYQPRYTDAEHTRTCPVTVRTPSGVELPVEDPALLSELSALAGEPLHMMHLGRGAYDSMPLSVLATTTLETLQPLVGPQLSPMRFRPNLLVQLDAGQGFPEDGWLGRRLRFGSDADALSIRVMRPIPRCSIVNLDPETAERDASVLKAVVREHDECVGVHAAPENVGWLTTGLDVFVE